MQHRILDITTPVNNLSPALLWLLYAIAGVLLLVLIYIFSEKNKIAKRKAYYKDKTKRLDNELTQKAQVITALTSQNEKLEKELADSELDRKALEDRLKLLDVKKLQPKTESQPPPVASPVAAAPTAAQPTLKPAAAPPKAPVANVKHARYADMGDGFSNAELLEKPDGETIFEIIIAPNNNTGEYKVAANAEAQRYALSNAQYFLGKTCQYDSFPSGTHAIIKTDKPGTVKLTAGKWMIVNPAKISFS